MDTGFDYGRMFIVKDALCEGTQWHRRDLPKDPAADPYFPMGQAALTFKEKAGNLIVTLKTLTPNFKQFEVSIDNGDWKVSSDKFEWTVRTGKNSLKARTMNTFGVTGSVSMAEFEVR